MLILASNSPRRKQLLSLGGWDFNTLSPNVDETVLPDEAPVDYVLRVTLVKARSAENMLEKKSIPDDIILAADTAVVVPGSDGWGYNRILGKPSSTDEALEMLQCLRGRTHQVYTGLVAVRLRDHMTLSKVVSTAVEMRSYSDQEMQAYVASGDPMDKAGAYAIQSQSFHPVQNLQGCYANVMGLPLCHVAHLLSGLECPPSADIYQSCQQMLNFRCEVYTQIQSF
jgi:septum formation protein